MPRAATARGEARACPDTNSSAVVGRFSPDEIDALLAAVGGGFLPASRNLLAQELRVLDLAQAFEARRAAEA